MMTPSGKKKAEKPLVLVVDDHASFCMVVEVTLSESYRVVCVESAEKALDVAMETQPDAALVDIVLPGISGLDLLEPLRRISPSTIPIVITGVMKNSLTAVRAMKAGAHNFLEKPFDSQTLLEAVGEAIADRKGANGAVSHPPVMAAADTSSIWGKNPQFLYCIRTATEIAQTDLPVLIEGETGTGKELFAKLIHSLSHFSEGELADVNCGTLSLGLSNTDLFGHEKGAFTGAESRRPGAFDRSMKGTLFLDEICDLPLEVQPALLRVLQEKEFMRVGGAEKIPWDGRLICATNQDIEAMVAKKTFRMDLFHRILGARIKIPPLRNRLDDIPILARGFLRKYGTPSASFGREVFEALMPYHWPGNVRELEMVVQRILSHAPYKEVCLDDIKAAITEIPSQSPLPSVSRKPGMTLKEIMGILECKVILRCYERNGHDLQKTAKELDIHPGTLYRKLRTLKSNE